MSTDPFRSPLDAHLDGASRAVDEHVADYVSPPFDPDGAPRRISSAATATVIAAVLVLVAGMVAFASGDPGDGGDQLVMQREDSAESSDEAAFAGPRDGLDSLQLPVQVDPAVGLADGQSVTVRGSGFPPNRTLGVVMCAGFEGGSPGSVANCQISPYTQVSSDANGNFEVQHIVDRTITTQSGQRVDCADAEDPASGLTCYVAVGALDDYDQSGIAEVHFDAGLPALPEPYVSIDPTGPYDEGQAVTITVGDVGAGAQFTVDVCAYGADNGGCTSLLPSMLVADASGLASTTVTIHRKVDVGFGAVDCGGTDYWCEINVYGPDYGQSFQLTFVGAVPPTVPGENPGAETTETTVTNVAPPPTIPLQQDPTTTTTAPSTSTSSTPTTAPVTTTTSGG